MSISSVEDLARILRQVPLLEPAQQDEINGPLKKQFSDAKLLARELVRRGWLTPFQVNQIFQGRAAELVLGSYVLLERLGEGGMGEVFKARNWKLGRIVALKLIRKERVSRPETIRRFQREIRAAAKLIHPNVVLAHDADEVNGTHFFTMDHIEGIDLAKKVKQSGPLPIAFACDYIRQAALGLQHAHEHGMVHRDIKPHNLLLSVVDRPLAAAKDHGQVKILDMGLARLHQPDDGDNSSTSLTQEGLVLGTVDYLAPEQALNAHQADIRADLYSLGCTLYFLLTGQVPFPGGTATEKLIRHQCDPAVPVESLRPEVPAALAALVRRLMAKRPEERIQTPAELALVLEKLAGGDALSSPPREPAPIDASPFSPLDSTGGTTVSADSFIPRARARHSPSKAIWLGGAVVLALVLLSVAIWLRSRDPQPVTPGPGNEPATLSYRVDARRSWQDTSIEVKAGVPVAVTFKGKWQSKNTEPCSAEGNEKAPRDRAVWADCPALCLLARIGKSEGVIPLGLMKGVMPAADGRLFVQPNYLDLDELSGSIRLEIKGGIAGNEVGPAPGPVRTQRADSELRALQARVLRPKEGAEALRRDLLAFTGRFTGTHQEMAAAELLMPLASPLDGQDANNIPPQELKAAGGGDPARAPLGLVAILGHSRPDDEKPVVALALSRDDRRLVTLGPGPSVRVWDPATGKSRAGPWDKAGPVIAIAMSPDGKRLAAVIDKHNLKEWNLDNGQVLSSKDQSAAIRCLDYSADGECLAAGLDNGTVVIWRSGTETELFRGKEEKAAIVRVLFRPDGRRLASSAADRSMRLWDLAGTKKDVSWKSSDVADTLAFRPDGGMLATAGKSLRLLNPSSGKDLFVLRHPGKDAYVAGFRADGAVLIYADSHGKLVLWDVLSRKELRRWELPGRVSCVASSSDGRHLFTGNRDGTVYTIRLGPPAFLAGKAKTLGSNPLDAFRHETIPQRELSQAIDKLSGMAPPELVAILGRGALRHGGVVHAMAISPDGKHIASAGGNHLVKIWDAATGKQVGLCKGHVAAVLSLAYSPDGTLLASAGRDNTVRIWDAAERKTRQVLKENLGEVAALAFGPRGERLAAGGSNGAIKVWNLHSGKILPWLKGHSGPVKKLAFSADGTSLYSAGTDGKAIAWEPLEAKNIAEVKGLVNLQRASAFLPDGGGLIALDLDGKPVRIDWHGERTSLPLEGSPRVHSTLALSNDGKTLALDSGTGTIRLHDRGTGRRIRELTTRFGIVSLAFSPNGDQLLVVGLSGIHLWDLGSEKESALVTGHRGAVRDLALSADGHTLISAGWDGSILLWDLAKATIKNALLGDATPLTNLALSSDESRLAAAARGGSIKAWALPAGREIFARRVFSIPNDVIWSPDGQQLLVGLDNGTLATWESTSGRETSSFKVHPKGIACLAFSADGQRLASGGKDRAVKLWQWRPWRELLPLYLSHPVDSLAFSPDGERLAIGSNGIMYKDTIRGKSLGELEGATSPIRLAYHPNGNMLASVDAAGRLNVWANITSVRRWHFEMPLHSVAFSADGRYLFAGSDLGTIFVFRVADFEK